MATLSIAMIAHNEADIIRTALGSVAWADQIVVIDCSSDDNTADIAREAGAEVFNEPNQKNLNINKNKSIERCICDWILVLDADEVIPYDLAGEIRLVINDPKHEGYWIKRKNFVLGRWLKHSSSYPDRQLRLFKNGKGRFPADHIHERLRIDGNAGLLDIPFEHHTYRNIDDMFRKLRRDVDFESQYMFDKGIKENAVIILPRIFIQPFFRFFRRYILKGGFLDGIPGLIMAFLDIWNQIMRWMRLWDLRRRDRAGDRS
ncbi:glycosyltransferase family 2 protein [bacterium]|nr:glycosyltransferase family 2 protein [bacterium]